MLLYLISLFTSSYPFSCEPYFLTVEDDMTELRLKNIQGSEVSKLNYESTAIRVFKSTCSLKLNVMFDEKVNIKIEDKYGLPVYLRQCKPNNFTEIHVDISGWYSGIYKICFTNTLDESFLSGEFKI